MNHRNRKLRHLGSASLGIAAISLGLAFTASPTNAAEIPGDYFTTRSAPTSSIADTTIGGCGPYGCTDPNYALCGSLTPGTNPNWWREIGVVDGMDLCHYDLQTQAD